MSGRNRGSTQNACFEAKPKWLNVLYSQAWEMDDVDNERCECWKLRSVWSELPSAIPYVCQL